MTETLSNGLRPMASADEVARQIDKLSELNLKRKPGKAGVVELARVLGAVSWDDQHCSLIVDEWIRDSEFWPTPAEIYRVARSTLPSAASVSFACEKCGGTGWLQVKGNDRYTGVIPCSCREKGGAR